jgi:hypothetical protein
LQSVFDLINNEIVLDFKDFKEEENITAAEWWNFFLQPNDIASLTGFNLMVT